MHRSDCKNARDRGCRLCNGSRGPGFPFSFAFQPIVDLEHGTLFSYEALVRGPAGEPAATVLGQVNDANLAAFDHACRRKVIELATDLRLRCNLNINFSPAAIYEPMRCIQAALETADRVGFPVDRIIFEFTEGDRLVDDRHLARVIETYRALGFRTALDDFGAGHSGLGRLCDFQPDFLKLDRKLCSNIDSDPVKQIVAEGLLQIAGRLGVTLVAEGVERAEEVQWFRHRGVALFQGFYFARPAFETLPAVLSERLRSQAPPRPDRRGSMHGVKADMVATTRSATNRHYH